MENLIYQTEFLSFYKYHPSDRKTPIYHIRPVRNDFDYLGCVKWYGPFRKYTFYPEGGTVFDDKCLNDISYFIKNLAGKEGY